MVNSVANLGSRGVAHPLRILCSAGSGSGLFPLCRLSPCAGPRLEIVVSIVPQPWPQPAPQLAAAVAVTYRGKRERPLPVLLRGSKLGEWLSDEQFAGAYGVRGTGWPPGRLTLVTVFQKAENLTSRQVAEAVRTWIDWKYARGHRPRRPGGPPYPGGSELDNGEPREDGWPALPESMTDDPLGQRYRAAGTARARRAGLLPRQSPARGAPDAVARSGAALILIHGRIRQWGHV